MKTAIVSAHIYLDEDGDKDIEILTQVDNDNRTTDIFDDISHALLDQIEPKFDESGSYFFIAVVKSEFIRTEYFEGVEYDVEHDVTEINSLADFNIMR